jgi:hypothetical protein
LADPILTVNPGSVVTEVIWVDTFGNVQLSATPSDAAAAGFGEHIGEDLDVITPTARVTVQRVTAFVEIAEGRLGLFRDATGHLALAGDQSSAARTLGLCAGDSVTLAFREPK